MSTKALADFQKKYDPAGDLTFGGIKFRPGALFSVGPAPRHNPITFGLTEGYKRNNAGKIEWGWVRIHTGEDRGATRAGGLDVFQPFTGDRAELAEDPDTRVIYGALQRTICEQWGFEFRLAHMDPVKDFEPEALACFRRGVSPVAGMRLGMAGGLGLGGIPHSHAELVSLDQSAPVLDEILYHKFGGAAAQEYTPGEIFAEYRRQEHTESWSMATAMRDYDMAKSDRAVIWSNRFKHVFKDRYAGGAIRTRYSTRLLFGM